MKILEELYFGELLPYEKSAPQNEEYRSLNKKISEERDYLISKLSKEDAGRFEKLNDFFIDASLMQSFYLAVCRATACRGRLTWDCRLQEISA